MSVWDLSVVFVLVAKEDEFESYPNFKLTSKGERELFENITTIEYGLNGLVHGDNREADYKLRAEAKDDHFIKLNRIHVELTQPFNIFVIGLKVKSKQVTEDIRRIFNEQITPAFTSPDQAPKIAHLPTREH